MVCIEQTHNRLGGRVLTLDYMAALADWYGASLTQSSVPVSDTLEACISLCVVGCLANLGFWDLAKP
jgi:hypothetical protein